MNEIRIYLSVLFILFSPVVYGANFYINGDLGNDNNPGTIERPWKTLNKANITLQAGDTVYIRGGTEDYQVYNVTSSSDCIAPLNSGTSNEARITYSVYPGEKVELRGNADTDPGSRGINLQYKNYITVTGIENYGLKITKTYMGFNIGPPDSPSSGFSRYNEISYTWIGFNANTSYYRKYNHSTVRHNAQYNHIHHCKFEKIGTLEGSAQGGMLDIGLEEPSKYGDPQDYYNIVEDCEFLHNGHHSLKPMGKYNVVRNNYLHNEEWYKYEDVLVSYRISETIVESGQGHHLIEGNRIGHNGLDYANTGNSVIKFGISDCIVRYNAFFNGTWYGFYVVPQIGPVNFNYIYNNTIFNFVSQRGYRFPYVGSWNNMSGNKIKNNLHWETYGTINLERDYYIGNSSWDDFTGTGPGQGANVVEGNFNDLAESGERVVDPLFISEDCTHKSSWTIPNLNLKSNSPAVGKGINLTRSIGSGANSNTLIVDDARYFQDGKFGSSSGCDPSEWPSHIDIYADWIAIGTVTNVVQISSIDYSANRIVLSSPMTWSDNAPIWLYKISSGKRVLFGSAPDPGAHERVSIMFHKHLNSYQ